MKEYILNNITHLVILLIIAILILIAIFKKNWSEKIFHGLTLLLMFITYWTIFALTAIILKIIGKKLIKPFSIKEKSYWCDYPKQNHSIENAKKQG